LIINNLYSLINPTTAAFTSPFGLTFFPLVLTLFWYLMIVVFHYALKHNVTKNKYLNDQKKNYEEARFLEKTERRDFLNFRKKEKEKVANGAYKPELGTPASSELDD